MNHYSLNKATNEGYPLNTSNDIECNENESMANNNMEVIFLGQNAFESNHLTNKDTPTSSRTSNQFSSCKTLQRKLELKVERARRNFSQNSGNESPKEMKSNNSCLIPIDRLPIPGHKENVQLVEYKSDESEDDEVSSPFFPMKSKPPKKLDLSDTFSLQEMTIESDSDDDSGDSQNLELLPPSARIKFIDKIISYLCCANPEPLS